MSTSVPRLAFWLGAVAAAAAVGAMLLASPPGARGQPATPAAVACSLIPTSKLLGIVGLGHSAVMRDYDGTVPISEAVKTECDVVAWSGPTPTSARAALQTAKSGHGAQVGVETWAPHEGSPNVQNWLDEDYDTLTGGFLIKSLTTFPWLFTKAGGRAKSFTPPRLGHQATGLTAAAPAPARGLVVAIGCWWEDKSSKAICLLDEEAASKPVVAHLNKLAHIAVPKFL